jgi:hypothetical protein
MIPVWILDPTKHFFQCPVLVLSVPTSWCQLRSGLQQPDPLNRRFFTLQSGYPHNTGFNRRSSFSFFGGRDYYCIQSNFWKFYLIRTGFILGELVFLVKVFNRSEQIVLVFRVWTQYVDVQHLAYWQGQCVCDALFCRRNKSPLQIVDLWSGYHSRYLYNLSAHS